MAVPGDPGNRRQPREKWHGPFGGTFNASFTATSEYTYAGISNSARQPAAQMNFDYRSPDLFTTPQTWIYLSSFMSNVVVPAGTGIEIDAIGGVKFKLLDKLRLDLGYVRVTYPGFPGDLGAMTTAISTPCSCRLRLRTDGAERPAALQPELLWQLRLGMEQARPAYRAARFPPDHRHGKAQGLWLARQPVGRALPAIRNPERRLLVLAARRRRLRVRARHILGLHRYEHRHIGLQLHQLLRRPRILRHH